MKDILPQIRELLSATLFKAGDFHLTVQNIVLFLAILGITSVITRLFERFYKRAVIRRMENQELGTQLAFLQIIKYVIYSLGFAFAIQSLGIDITILLAGSAALFVGIGFGLQQTFNDIFSGLILLVEGSVQVGHIIQTPELKGEIKRIGVRTSIMETKDKVSMIVPNSKLTMNEVINLSYSGPSSRFKVAVGVAYGSEVELVRNILLDVAKQNVEVLSNPPPKVLFADFGDSALMFELYFTTRKLLFSDALKSDIRFAIDKAFRENDIHIPFPQRDLHLKSPDPITIQELKV